MKAALDIAVATVATCLIAVIGVLTHHHKALLGAELALCAAYLVWARIKKAKTSPPVRPDEDGAK